MLLGGPLMLSTIVLALSLGAGSGLRLVNPSDTAVDAVVRCGGMSRAVRVEGHDLVDLAPSAVCVSPVIEALTPIVAFETSNESVETQRLLDASANAACDPVAMAVPLFACERGSASASVNPVNGATYAWSVEGATITSGQGTPRVAVSLGDAAIVRLTVVITADSCSRTASGIIAVRKPLSIAELKVPAAADAGTKVTIEWSYPVGIQPGAQLLRGDAFAAPVVLTAEQRSYAFTPNVGGTRTIELVASYAPAIPTVVVPKGSKRRAAGSTLVGSTGCTVAQAQKQFTLRCNAFAPSIETVADAESGKAFTAQVHLEEGESARWSASGGTIVSGEDSDRIEVVPDDFVSEVGLSVTIARTNNCSVESQASVRVHPRQACVSHPPVANVTLTGRACASATVQATFSGTPPFRGYWSDGARIETNQSTITHEFTSPGAYTIAGFTDATCAGNVNSTAEVHSFNPGVTLTTDQFCPEATVTAHFTGTPPFKGRFMPGEWFETNESTISMKVPREWTYAQVLYVTDANCPNGGEGASSNVITLNQPSEVWLEPSDLVCVADYGGYLTAHFINTGTPFSVQWSDGVVTTLNDPSFPHIYRTLMTSKFNDTISIVRAWDAHCDAVVRNSTVTLSYRPIPQIDTYDNTVCRGSTGKIGLTSKTLHPDTQFTWTATNAEILSGQGTREITFKPPTEAGWSARIWLQATFPDGHCDPAGWRDNAPIYVRVPAAVSNFVAATPTFKAGGSTTLTFDLTGDDDAFLVKPSDPARADEISMGDVECALLDPNGIARRCHVTYRNLHGAGSVAVDVLAYGRCNGPAPASASLTLTITN